MTASPCPRKIALMDMDNLTDSEAKALARALGKRGASKGGHARAKRLTAERRLEISRKANSVKSAKRSA